MRRRLSPLAVLLALMLLIPSCSDRVPDGYGSLSIRVSDDTENAKMISYNPGDGNDASMTHYRVTILDSTGAEAAKSGLMSFMGGEGSFTITNMVSGSYTIKAEGFVGSEENLIATGEAPVTVRPNSTASTAIAIDTFIDEPAASVAITFELPDECVVDGKANGTLKYSVKRVDSDELVVPEKSVTITSSIALTNGAYTATLTDSVPAGRFILLASYEDASGLVYSSADAMLIYPGLPATGTVSLDSSLAFDADFTITDKIGHTLEVTGSGEYRASDDTVVITLTKALSASELVLWYVDGKAVTPVANGSAYTFSGLAKGDRQIIGIVWDMETKATIGSLVVELRVSGTIAVSEKQTFANYFDVPVVTEQPSDGSSCWISFENGNLLNGEAGSLPPDVEGQKLRLSEMAGNAEVQWLSDISTDDTEYTMAGFGYFMGIEGRTNSIFMQESMKNISGEKVYIRFGYNDNGNNSTLLLYSVGNPSTANDLIFIVMNNSGEIVSAIGDFPAQIHEWEPYCGYILSADGTYPIDLPFVTEPVCVVIDDYADFWAKQGLETDEEIRAYLDSLPYESFVAPEKEESQTLTVPENLLADIKHGNPSGMPTELLASGTAENMVVGNTSLNSTEQTELPNEDWPNLVNIETGLYYGLPLNASLYFMKESNAEPLIPLSHKLYWRLDSSSLIPTSSSFLMLHAIFGSETSDLGFESYAIGLERFDSGFSGITPSFDYVQGYGLFLLMDKQMFDAPSSFVLNHPIVVDITANQAFFDALSLTTDEEIKAYLDTIVFENFGVATVTV